jgi:hypothetical protein
MTVLKTFGGTFFSLHYGKIGRFVNEGEGHILRFGPALAKTFFAPRTVVVFKPIFSAARPMAGFFRTLATA